MCNAILGTDVATSVSASTWDCVKKAGFNFTIIRAWHSTGTADTAAPATVRAAKGAGMETDVYFFPCRGKAANSQMDEFTSFAKGMGFGKVWFDIETNPSSGCGWGSNTQSNCQYMADLIAGAKKGGFQVGIYSSATMWSTIMGSCTSAKEEPLWYAHYDHNPSFSDFKAFGGWSTPTIKQFSDGPAVCGVDMDHNYKK